MKDKENGMKEGRSEETLKKKERISKVKKKERNEVIEWEKKR